jgi:hypothetical protein
LEWWNFNLHNEGQSLNENQNQGNIDVTRAGALPNMNIESSSIFQSTPYGKGVIICNKNQNIPLENMNINSNKNDIREPNSIPKRSDFFDVTLQGYPRDTLALKKVFSPLTEDLSTYGEGPSTCLATIKEKILGVKWGIPGRFLPPSHSGLELLIMTESAALHVIKVPVEICSNVLIKDVYNVTINKNKNDGNNENIISLNKPKYLLKKSLNFQNNMRQNINKSSTSVNSNYPDLFYSNPATVNSATGNIYIYIYIYI